MPPPPPGVVVVVVVVGGMVVVVVVVVVVGGVVVVVVVVVVGGRVVVVTGDRVVVVESLLGGMVEDPSSVASLSAMLSPSSPPIVVEVEDAAGLVVDAPCSPSTSTPVKDPRLSTRVDSEVPAVEPNTATTTTARTPMASKVRKMPLAASFIGSPAIGTFPTHSPRGTLASRFVSDHGADRRSSDPLFRIWNSYSGGDPDLELRIVGFGRSRAGTPPVVAGVDLDGDGDDGVLLGGSYVTSVQDGVDGLLALDGRINIDPEDIVFFGDWDGTATKQLVNIAGPKLLFS